MTLSVPRFKGHYFKVPHKGLACTAVLGTRYNTILIILTLSHFNVTFYWTNVFDRYVYSQ